MTEILDYRAARFCRVTQLSRPAAQLPLPATATAAGDTTIITSSDATINAAGPIDGDIVAALNLIAEKLDKIAAKSCCCCGGRQDKGQGAIAYVQCADRNYAGGSSRLVSYYAPLASQAEADNVNTLIYLGTIGSANNASLGDSFTLDGFTMPGIFPVKIETLDSFPLTLMRSKDGTGWLSLTSPAYAINTERPLVDPSKLDDENANRSGLYYPNYRGKVFTAAIDNAEESGWTEERKQEKAFFTLERSPFYGSFPLGSDDEISYEVRVAGRKSDGSVYFLTWGEIIAMFGSDLFYVSMVDYGEGNPIGIVSRA